MKGIAFKVTYNDGGANGGLIGFRGVCSDRNIFENVRVRHMTNCADANNPCCIYAGNDFKGRRPVVNTLADYWCYEAGLLARDKLRFGSGYWHNGPNAGQPIPVKGVEVGDIAFLTTLLPAAEQNERIIFGCYRVGKPVYFMNGWGYLVESDGTMDLRLPDDVATQTNFWRYYANRDGSQFWGTGLFRHLSEQQTEHVLGDLLGLLGDHEERDVLLEALAGKVKPRPVRRLPVVDGTPRAGGAYGGGEGVAHLKLKEFVAKNPQKIGLPKQAVASIEFPYLSGDQVDVKFDLPGGRAAVVEIETINPLPGAHQCVKYRALLEAARGEPLGSGSVDAILVAHRFDRETALFAETYGIRLVELIV